MKAYCFSDYHDEQESLPEMRKLAGAAEIVISAGDHTIFEHKQASILREFSSWRKPVYLLHGNHETEGDLRTSCEKHPHLHFIHAQEVVVKGVRLLGWGSGGFSSHDRALERQVKEWKRSPHNHLPTILVTHQPPSGTALDDLDGRSVGSRSVRRAIEELRPTYSISGHIHETAGAEDLIGETRCYNLGVPGRLLRL